MMREEKRREGNRKEKKKELRFNFVRKTRNGRRSGKALAGARAPVYLKKNIIITVINRLRTHDQALAMRATKHLTTRRSLKLF